MQHQRFLDLARINILASGNDHVFFAVDDKQVALIVEITEVARMHPAIANRLLCRLRIVPIALHDDRGMHADFADLANAAFGSVLAQHLDVGAKKRLSCRCEAPRFLHAAFGQVLMLE